MQLLDCHSVPCDVSSEFGIPVTGIGLRLATFSTSFRLVLVPEAAVDEDHLSTARKDQVWFTRQILPVEPIAIAGSIQEPPHEHLWLGVSAADASHIG